MIQLIGHMLRKKKIKKMIISRSIKGVCSELIAVKEFLKKGYYVARSIDPQCPFDIIVVDKKGKGVKGRVISVKDGEYGFVIELSYKAAMSLDFNKFKTFEKKYKKD